MNPLNAQEVYNDWATQTKNRISKYKSGISRVSVNPAEKAAQKANEWAAGVQRALSNGKYVSGLQKVSLSSWQQAALGKGAQNIATGVDAASTKEKMLRHLADALPFAAQVKETIRAMPKGTFEDGMARGRRAAEMMRDHYAARRGV